MKQTELVPLKTPSRSEAFLNGSPLPEDFRDPGLPKGVFSHSQYTKYKSCPRAYMYQYVEKVPTRTSLPLCRGSAVHSGAEHALKEKMAGRLVTLEEVLEVTGKSFEHHTDGLEAWDDEEPGAAKDKTLLLYRAFHEQALPNISPVAVEQGFAKRVGTVPMLGWIDYIDRKPALAVSNLSPEDAALAPMKDVLVDLKTGKSSWSEKEVRQDTQLTLYAHVTGNPHVRIDQVLMQKAGAAYKQAGSERSPTDVAVLVEDIEETVDLIKKGVFPRAAIDHWSCNEKYCSFWSICRGRKR